MKHWSIQRKLGMSFGGLVAAVAIGLAFIFMAADSTKRHSKEADTEGLPFLAAISGANSLVEATSNDERGYLLSGNMELHDKTFAQAAGIKASLEDAIPLATEAQKARIEQVIPQVDAWMAIVEEEFALWSQSPEQAAYIGVPVDGPFKPEHYRY